MRRILHKHGDPTLGRIESLPQCKIDASGDGFLAGDIFDGGELLEAPDDVVIGQDAVFVGSGLAVGH